MAVPFAVSAGEESISREQLYARHIDAVGRWVANLAGPGADVEDLAHEVFMIAFQRLDEFRGEAKLSTWLYRIAINVVRNARRRARVRRWFALGDREVASDAPLPDEAIDRERRRRAVYAIFDRLSEKDRLLLVMFEIEQLSGAEIAERLAVNIGTVWVRLHRARAQFIRRANESGVLP